MRSIGHLDGEVKARSFSDFLLKQKIEHRIEGDNAGSWTIWILAEEELERAKDLLTRFLEEPANAKLPDENPSAEDSPKQKRNGPAQPEKSVKQERKLFRFLLRHGFGPVTMLLMLSSIAVFVQSDYSRDFRPVYRWFISQQDVAGLEDLTPWRAFLLRSTHLPSVLPEIRHGEIWRLITPIFIHLGFLQIFFNLLWLRELGTTVEARQNSLVLLILVLVFAMVSNVAQDLMHGPAFGGMSGVVYALAAYIWMRGKLDPGSGLFLYPATVAMMLIWFFACLIGFEGGMTATTAHVVGLLMGMTWGCLSRRHHRRNSSPKQPIRMI